jgi:hypothetical protein
MGSGGEGNDRDSETVRMIRPAVTYAAKSASVSFLNRITSA